MSNFKSPVYNVIAVPIEKVTANDYNPNSVAPPEMALLETSIWEDGYTQPVVTVYDKERDMYVVVDGFHRYLTLKTSKRIYERENGLLPCVVLDKEMHDRMASTIRHNRARGQHVVVRMADIIAELLDENHLDEAEVMRRLGMDKEEVRRLHERGDMVRRGSADAFSTGWTVEAQRG